MRSFQAELFLCVYHPLHSNVSSQDVSVPFTSSYGLSITSGRISRVTFPLRSVHCGAKPLIVILRSDGTLNWMSGKEQMQSLLIKFCSYLGLNTSKSMIKSASKIVSNDHNLPAIVLIVIYYVTSLLFLLSFLPMIGPHSNKIDNWSNKLSGGSLMIFWYTITWQIE